MKKTFIPLKMQISYFSHDNVIMSSGNGIELPGLDFDGLDIGF